MIESMVKRVVLSYLKSSEENIDPKQLSIGKKVEEEHKDVYDKIMAYAEEKRIKPPFSEGDFYEAIAIAHLKEAKKWKNDKYYTELKKMEKEMKL